MKIFFGLRPYFFFQFFFNALFLTSRGTPCSSVAVVDVEGTSDLCSEGEAGPRKSNNFDLGLPSRKAKAHQNAKYHSMEFN